MTAENNLQLNRRILSVVMFTFVCYLTIGLPLAVLPGFVHDHLGYNSVLAGLIISAQYFATLFSRPHAGRYADQLGPKKVVLFGWRAAAPAACFMRWRSALTVTRGSACCCCAWGGCFSASAKASPAPVPRCGVSAGSERCTPRG